MSGEQSPSRLVIANLTDIRPGQLITLSARFYKSTLPPKEVNITDERNIKCLENCRVIDDTGSFPITIWGGQIDSCQNEECYDISDLKVKVYQGSTHLSTTPNTVFKRMEDDPVFPKVSRFYEVY